MGRSWFLSRLSPRYGRHAIAALLIAAVAACAGPQRHPRPTRPLQPSLTLRQCLAKLDNAQIRYTPLPDRIFSGGCSAIGTVQLRDIGVPVTNLGAMTCPLASNFAAWARYGVQPAARQILGSEIVRIDSFGTYACRPIAGTGRLSEHGRSNAVDVGAFLLADGRRVTVKTGWNGDPQEQRFLRAIRASACRRFNTVLSPDYNADHHDHLHFDMGGKAAYCR